VRSQRHFCSWEGNRGSLHHQLRPRDTSASCGRRCAPTSRRGTARRAPARPPTSPPACLVFTPTSTVSKDHPRRGDYRKTGAPGEQAPVGGVVADVDATRLSRRVVHGLGWLGLGWVEIFQFLVGWVGLGPLQKKY